MIFRWLISAVLRYLGIRVGAPRDRIADTLTIHEQRMHDELRIAGKLPVRDGYIAIQERIATDRDWHGFVRAHMQAFGCPDCLVVVPEPSEAEDAAAVWRPCRAHQPEVGR